MPRYISSLPSNIGFYNLGTVETYPVGGSGPVAYGSTGYFGSSPLPQRGGDSINNPLNLGDLTAIFRSITLSNKHGGKSRIQSSFYQFTLTKPRTIQLIQNYSPTSYQENTNRNTIVSFYKVEDGTHRRELPINNSGYVYKETSIAQDDSYESGDGYYSDYPLTPLDAGTYVLIITNDIRYLETTYSFTINSLLIDWRYVYEVVDQTIPCGLITDGASSTLDFGDLTTTPKNTGVYPYSSTSGLGYTRAGVSP